MIKKGRGKSRKSLEIIEASVEILTEIQPATVRAVCYRLFVRGLIPSMSKSSTNSVGAQLVYARENGIIPWEWIVDETREVERANTWDNPEQIIRQAVSTYRRDYWQDQPNRVEVVSEKGTVRGTLAPVLRDFGVSLRVMHGYGSATALNDLAEASNDDHKPLVLLYCGDYDPSGLHMSEVDLPARLERYGGKATIKRIALTADDTLHLPHFDAASKAGDTRHKWFVDRYGTRCWELDALPPNHLRERLAEEIALHLDVGAWEHAKSIENVEMASMKDFFRQWTISRPAYKYSGPAGSP